MSAHSLFLISTSLYFSPSPTFSLLLPYFPRLTFSLAFFLHQNSLSKSINFDLEMLFSIILDSLVVYATTGVDTILRYIYLATSKFIAPLKQVDHIIHLLFISDMEDGIHMIHDKSTIPARFFSLDEDFILFTTL